MIEAHRIVLQMFSRLSKPGREAKRVLAEMIIGGKAVDSVTPLCSKARKAEKNNVAEEAQNIQE